eukprot:3607253-Karenia_brevis.AAC.1
MATEEATDTRSSPRFVVIDIETNGFAEKNAPRSNWTLPFSSYPIQVSVDIVEDGQVHHAYDCIVHGARGLAAWVQKNVPITLEDIQHGRPFQQVLEDIAGLLQDGDTIVAHNVAFDLDTAIARTARKLNLDTPALRRILEAPRFCTMRCAYSRQVFGRAPPLHELCKHFEVDLQNAHDATADSIALANCLAEAVKRGVMVV